MQTVSENKGVKKVYCKRCQGVGEINTYGEYVDGTCPVCDGTGILDNEHWLGSLSTEEKADAIKSIVFDVVGEFIRERTPSNRWFKKEYWLNWLKREHEEGKFL